MKYTKPYFGKDVEDKIVSVINSELAKESKTCDESAIRRYIQAGKNTYENAILSGVAEGQYLATVVQKGEIAYKVNLPSETEIDDVLDRAKQRGMGIPTAKQVELAIKHERGSRLSHAINMVAMYGKSPKLGVVPVASAPPVEGNATPESQPTAEANA